MFLLQRQCKPIDNTAIFKYDEVKNNNNNNILSDRQMLYKKNYLGGINLARISNSSAIPL